MLREIRPQAQALAWRIRRMGETEFRNFCKAQLRQAVPGAIAAKLVHPERNIVAVTGDAGFLMNSQEIETAMRCRLPIVILIVVEIFLTLYELFFRHTA